MFYAHLFARKLHPLAQKRDEVSLTHHYACLQVLDSCSERGGISVASTPPLLGSTRACGVPRKRRALQSISDRQKATGCLLSLAGATGLIESWILSARHVLSATLPTDEIKQIMWLMCYQTGAIVWGQKLEKRGQMWIIFMIMRFPTYFFGTLAS